MPKNFVGGVTTSPHTEAETKPPPLNDRDVAEWVVQGLATDAYYTKDRAPIMSERVLALLRPFADAGLIAIDESTAPMRYEGPHLAMGRAWASLTDKGRTLFNVSK